MTTLARLALLGALVLSGRCALAEDAPVAAPTEPFLVGAD
jgi:hypothetical protein